MNSQASIKATMTVMKAIKEVSPPNANPNNNITGIDRAIVISNPNLSLEAMRK